jgi:hypothetical protein
LPLFTELPRAAILGNPYAAGRLEGTRFGKQTVRVRRDVLERFLEDCTEGGNW